MGPGGAAEEGKGTGEEAGGNKQRQNAKGAWGSNLEKGPAGSPARTMHGGRGIGDIWGTTGDKTECGRRAAGHGLGCLMRHWEHNVRRRTASGNLL